MLVSNLLFELRQNGYAIQADGDCISISPGENLPVELVEQLKNNKREILTELQREAEKRKNFQACNQPASTAEQLHGFSLTELEKLAADDLDWLKQDKAALRAFAYAHVTLEELREGKVPAHYASKTICKHCGEVPVPRGLENNGKVDACMWCLVPLGKC